MCKRIKQGTSCVLSASLIHMCERSGVLFKPFDTPNYAKMGFGESLQWMTHIASSERESKFFG